MEITDYKPLIIFEAKKIFGRVNDDLIQEGFLIFLEAKRSFDVTRGVPFNAYLAQQLRFHYLEQARKRKPALSLQGRAGEERTLEEVLPAGENTEEAVMEMQMEENIKKAIGQLSDQQRTIIFEFFFHGKKLTQIAQEMQISYETVKTHKKRAMKKLRSLIPNEGEDSVRF